MTEPSAPQLEAFVRSGKISNLTLRGRGGGFVRSVLPPLVALACFVGIAYLFSYVFLSPSRRFLMPPPHEVVRNGLLNHQHLHEQLSALWDTAQVSLTGLAIAFAIGASLAIVMSQAKWIERSLYPYAVIMQVTPILAIVPLIALWFGYDFTARVVVCVLIAIFPIITNTLHGLLTVDANHHDLFTLHRSSRVARLVKLQLLPRDPGHLRRAEGVRRPLGGRRDRRRVLLPAGHTGSRASARPLPGVSPDRSPDERAPLLVRARDRLLLGGGVHRPPSHEELARGVTPVT